MSSVGEIMYYVYIIESELTEKYYIGFTSNLNSRWRSHKYFSSFKKSKLYDCIRKYGFDNFEMIVVQSFNSKEEACEYECSLISLDDKNCLNLAPGGEGGFNISDIEMWKQKLSIARQGRKPALGLKHSKENIAKFRLPRDRKYNVIGYSFKEAKEQFGISKTHYYRLLKHTELNDFSGI